MGLQAIRVRNSEKDCEPGKRFSYEDFKGKLS